MVELVEKFLEGIEGLDESLLVTSGTVTVAEGYSEELSYSSDYSI
ncbi:hypothetical protein [Candidatus Nanohalococcus occultus]